MPHKTAIIYMGGTFGCADTPLRPLPADIFLPKLNMACQSTHGQSCDFFYSAQIKDSSCIEPQDWHALIQQIEHLRAQHYNHFLVIHGTDTMAYSAAFLAEHYAQEQITLVFTGSQQPLLHHSKLSINQHSDALHNLNFALHTLHHATAGVWLAFDQHYWAAHTTQKIHSTAMQAFAGDINPPQPPPPLITKKLTDTQLNQLSHINIAVLYCLPMPDTHIAQQLQQLLATPHLDALIILAFGQGNMPHHPSIAEQLHAAQQRGLIIILSTQVAFGGTAPTYATGAWLQQLGCIATNHHSLAAVYAKTMYYCCQSTDTAQRTRAITHALA